MPLRTFYFGNTALSLIDSSRRTANACFKDAADLHAELENYTAAIARYDQVANGSLGSNLTKYSVKDYWLRAGLCALAMGVRYQHLHFSATSNPWIGHRWMPKEHYALHFPGHYLPVDTRMQVFGLPRRRLGSSRSGGIHCSRCRIRSDHEARQLEDFDPAEDQENHLGRAIDAIIYLVYSIQPRVRWRVFRL